MTFWPSRKHHLCVPSPSLSPFISSSLLSSLSLLSPFSLSSLYLSLFLSPLSLLSSPLLSTSLPMSLSPSCPLPSLSLHPSAPSLSHFLCWLHPPVSGTDCLSF